jgi:hypothetical protein
LWLWAPSCEEIIGVLHLPYVTCSKIWKVAPCRRSERTYGC